MIGAARCSRLALLILLVRMAIVARRVVYGYPPAYSDYRNDNRNACKPEGRDKRAMFAAPRLVRFGGTTLSTSSKIIGTARTVGSQYIAAAATSDSSGQMQKIQRLHQVVEKVIVKKSESSKREDHEEEETPEQKKRREATKGWQVVLHNDDVHTFTFVIESVVKIVPQISKAKAHTITIAAHSDGKALIAATWKSRAEMYCLGLQKLGLTVSVIPSKPKAEET